MSVCCGLTLTFDGRLHVLRDGMVFYHIFMSVSIEKTEEAEHCKRHLFICLLLAKSLIAVETAAEKAR